MERIRAGQIRSETDKSTLFLAVLKRVPPSSRATETVVTSTQLRAAALLRAAFAPVDRNGACA